LSTRPDRSPALVRELTARADEIGLEKCMVRVRKKYSPVAYAVRSGHRLL
jgi:hypothetical protein